MTSASSESFNKKTPKTTKPKKKNGFYVFMEENKPVLEERLERKLNFAELPQLLSEDWQKLSTEEKAEYTAKGREFTTLVRGENTIEKEKVRDQELQEVTDQTNQNRSAVWKLFSAESWAFKTIVVCSFSTYFEPDLEANEKYIPAEIGLTAFSLGHGVMDNFCRFIDPNDTIPEGRAAEVNTRVEEQGLPAIGIYEDLKNYAGLVDVVKAFLSKHRERTPFTENDGDDNPFYVFAFNSNLDLITKCFEWLFEAAGKSFPVKVLDLGLYAHLASTVNNLDYREANEEGAAGSSSCPSTSENRRVGKPFNKCFAYPRAFPMTRFGVFQSENEAEEAITSSDNYKYYNELCCIYHMKSEREGSHRCALNETNRYAFSLLEILTMSNLVKAIPGFHYPTLDEHVEVTESIRRCSMLRRWGLTEVEDKLMQEEDDALRKKAEEKLEERRQRRLLARGNREEPRWKRIGTRKDN